MKHFNVLTFSIIIAVAMLAFGIYIIFSGYTINIAPIYISPKAEDTQKVYSAEDFGIEVIKSNTDMDADGIDDYTDIVEGARIDAANHPEYKSAYYTGGYPPDTEGVCTDVIWRALKNAGYDLKKMVDEDIKNNLSWYPRVEGKPDPNIDFRRVKNLIPYFKKNHISLTTDFNDIAEWQPGDIIVFGEDHIGIISDKRNEKGIPYIIHNGGQPNREEDGIEFYNEHAWPVTYHFRLTDLYK